MIFVHEGTKPVERFDMPRCYATVEHQPYVRVYLADTAEDPAHRGYPELIDALNLEPAARGALMRLLHGVLAGGAV